MIGKVIGNYRITDELAQGGMGAIYRGHHLRLPREVVVKSILLDAFSASAQEHLKARFRREACIQSQLDHNNIVRVYEFFEAEENYYLVMEYVAGMSLRDLLDRQGVPTPAQTVYLFKQTLDALDYAHNFTYVDELNNTHTGIIHRDINPANLLLDHKGRIKITDFGAVKVTGESGLTQTGFHPGTVEYMSPEQLRGWKIDARSDLYSVGVTFYEMLTGQPPFPRPDEGSDWEVRKGHIELDPPSILNARPEVPFHLAVIVQRALQKDPDARYQSAAEFSAALRDYEQRLAATRQKSRGKSGKLALATLAVQTVIGQATVADDEPSSTDRRLAVRETLPMPPVEPPTPLAVLAGRATIITPLNAAKTFRDVARVTASISTGRKWGLTASVGALLLAGAVIGSYFIPRQDAKGEMQAAMTKVSDVPSKAAEPPAGDGPPSPQPEIALAWVDRAEELEREERYDEAIETYEAYLSRHPKASDASKVIARIAELRKFRELIETARAAANGNDLAMARRNYAEALQINPDSRIAKMGLTEVEGKIVVSPRPQR